jgi:D-alanine-D-alanine ligase-like ATP-grasp enzyme
VETIGAQRASAHAAPDRNQSAAARIYRRRSHCEKCEEIATAISGSAKYDRELLIEKFVSGRELTIGILGDQALPFSR